MDDLISRQAAIDTVSKWFYDVFGITESDGTATVFKRLRELPSAEPERKKGEWIPAFNGVFKGGAYWFSCSECGRIVPEVRNGGWNYCPNCGADMRGESDE